MALSARDYWSKKKASYLRVNSYAKRVFPSFPKNAAVLDLGCGYGADSMYFAAHGCRVTAVDIADANIKKIQTIANEKKLPIQARRVDLAQKLPFPSHSFDVIYAHLSLHYFDDHTTKKIFDELFRILHNGGLLFVKCKSIDDSLYGKGKKIGPDMFHSDHVRHFFSVPYMQECLTRFEVVTLRRSTSAYAGHRSACIEAAARKI